MEEEIVQKEQTAEEPARDYAGEVQALYRVRPELRGSELPEEVIRACVDGKPLTEAYSEFARKQTDRTERIRRQNAESGARGPVNRVGRASVPKGEDAFLRGFHSVW